jgi:alginate O-acetyltransferase complex protein AlgI
MLFPTVQFAVFFIVVFTMNWLLRPFFTPWRIFLVLASFAFYLGLTAAEIYPLGALLAGSIVLNWVVGHAVVAARRGSDGPTDASRWVVRGGVVANLSILVWFKYAGFLVVDVANGWMFFDIDPQLVEGIILPVGISFFTFHALSYVIDLGRGTIREPMTLLDFALYMSFFPHLVAGPIVRAAEFAPQIYWHPDPRRINSAPAFRLIALGMFKKVVISSYVAAEIVDPVFASPSEHSAWEVMWGILGYAVQIYADFSGYTDIAIGCALLLGFRFPQNFDAPYTALSMQDFWRRWHMTLSRWLRDYLYIPLGGNRKGVVRTYVNLMLTMVLGGLWHGASINFLVWGGIHGGTLAGERYVKERWRPRGLPIGAVRFGQWLLTFVIVCVAWVFFRSPELDLAMETLGQLFTGWGAPPHAGASLVQPMVIFVIVGMLAMQFVPATLVDRAQEQFSRVGLAWQALALGVGLLIVDSLGPEGVAPFIYFAF